MTDRTGQSGAGLPCDLHVHTALSHDAVGSVRECCEAALRRGVTAIGFAEHVDFDPTDPGYGFYDYRRCAAAIDDARSEFGQALDVLHGIEVDYQQWFECEIKAFLARHDFDYVMGSVHAVDRQPLMSCAHVTGRSEDDCYRRYFRAVRDCARSGLFDIIGHVEYAARRSAEAFGPYDPGRYGPEVDAVLTAVVEGGVCLEVNTSGLTHAQRITYPCAQTLQRFVELGGTRVCVGSDAHCPQDVGLGMVEAADALRTAGIGAVEVWRRRRPLKVPVAVRASGMDDARR